MKAYAATILFLAAVALGNWLALPLLGYRATGFVFLLCTLPVAVRAGLGPTLLFAATSALVWDFFFIPPRFTFSIQTSEDLMMNATYFIVAAVSGFLGSRSRRHERALREQEHEARLLYELERTLGDQQSAAGVLSAGCHFIGRRLGLEASALRSVDGEIDFSEPEFTGTEEEREHIKWTHRNEKRSGPGTSTFASAPRSYFPLMGSEGPAGVLAVARGPAGPVPAQNSLRLVCVRLGVALERERHRETWRRNELLEESEKLHQTLLNSVSHELRTPLTTIIGTISQLTGPETPARLAPAVLELKTASQRLSQTVTHLLDMSRISSGALQLNRSLLDLNDLVRTALAHSRHALERHRVEFSEAPLAYTLGDERILETAFTNLLANAAKNSPEGSEIRVAIKVRETDIAIDVQDRGSGVPAGQEEKVFERFHTSGSGGIGLGLAIVRAIVEAHEGNVSCEAGLNHGACFTIRLPRENLPEHLKAEMHL